MTDQTAAQEPTMEEILASIRRIISEDDAPAETSQAPSEAPGAKGSAPEPSAAAAFDQAAAPAPQPAPEPQPAPAPEAPGDDDVLDLTDRYQAPVAETIGDLDVSASTPEPFPAAEPHSSSAYAPGSAPASSSGGSLVGEAAASSAASAFAGLASSVRRPETTDAPPVAGPTIDEITRELLRPMLKEWLDANLPGIVEAAVRKEVERIARSAA